MSRERASRKTAPTGYVISQFGHLLFLRVRDHLRLLDRMTHARVRYDIPDLGLTPDELMTHLFFLLRDMEAMWAEMRPEIRQ